MHGPAPRNSHGPFLDRDNSVNQRLIPPDHPEALTNLIVALIGESKRFAVAPLLNGGWAVLTPQEKQA